MAGFRVVATTKPDGGYFGLPDELKDDIYDGLDYGNGRVVALGIGGRVVVSDDRGETFTSPAVSSGIESYELLFRRNRFIGVGRDLASTTEMPRALVVASNDGSAWAPLTAPLDGGSFIAFDASESAILAVGSKELDYALYRHTEVTGWQRVTPMDGPTYADVYYDGTAFLAIASNDPVTNRGVLARSVDDGMTFELSDMDPKYESITASSGQYMVSGFKRVAISDDAKSWQVTDFEAPSSRPEDANSWYFFKVAYDGCDYLAVGGIDGWMARSPDGVTWFDELGPTHGSLLEVIHVPAE